jgi:hypothetical protein
MIPPVCIQLWVFTFPLIEAISPFHDTIVVVGLGTITRVHTKTITTLNTIRFNIPQLFLPYQNVAIDPTSSAPAMGYSARFLTRDMVLGSCRIRRAACAPREADSRICSRYCTA